MHARVSAVAAPTAFAAHQLPSAALCRPHQCITCWARSSHLQHCRIAACTQPPTAASQTYPPPLSPPPPGLTLLGLAAPAACAGASFMPRSLALILPISSVSSQYLQGGSGKSSVKEMSWQQQLLPSCTHDTLRATVLVQVASHSTHVGCCASGAAPAPHITLALQSCQLVCLPAERSV